MRVCKKRDAQQFDTSDLNNKVVMDIYRRPNILVICGRNKRRSRTAEHIFKNDDRFAIRSAGLSPNSERKLSERDVEWSDLVLVMESAQKKQVTDTYRHLQLPSIEVLHIHDEFEFMDEALISILKMKMNELVDEYFGE